MRNLHGVHHVVDIQGCTRCRVEQGFPVGYLPGTSIKHYGESITGFAIKSDDAEKAVALGYRRSVGSIAGYCRVVERIEREFRVPLAGRLAV